MRSFLKKEEFRVSLSLYGDDGSLSFLQNFFKNKEGEEQGVLSLEKEKKKKNRTCFLSHF